MGSSQSAPDFSDTAVDTSLTTEELEAQCTKNHETYKSCWTSTSRTKLTELEAKFFRDHLHPSITFTQTIVGGLGTIELNADDTSKANKPALVLVHGYAACNAFWALSLEQLANRFRVFLVELHGHGRSDRTPFPANMGALEAELYMAEHIEKWRQEALAKDEKFYLVGHSLGGMITWRYASAYPDRLHQLILLSPVGVPDAPANLDERLARAPLFFRFLISRWKKGTSPMDVVRSLGPFGKSLMRKIVARRISMYPEASAAHAIDIDTLCEVMYQSWCLPESGERSMNAMLVPGAFAKVSLSSRLNDTTTPNIVPPPHLPIAMIYGSSHHDWMTPRFGGSLCTSLKHRAGHVYTSCREVSNAGHMVSMDNPAEFQQILLEEIDAGTAAAVSTM